MNQTETGIPAAPEEVQPLPEEIFEESELTVAAHLRVGPDGVLRWPYDLDLFRNPVIFLLVCKIFFWILFVMFGFSLLLAVYENGFADAFSRAIPQLAKVFGGLTVFFFLLIAVSYLIYALLMGGRYSVIFEMDKKGVRHVQLQRQFERAQLLSLISAMAGAASGRVSMVAPGLNAAIRQSTYSAFRKARTVTSIRRHGVIKIRTSDMVHNQVYAEPEDYDYVLDHIRAQTPQARFKVR